MTHDRATTPATDFREIRFLDDVAFLNLLIYRPQPIYQAPVAALSAAPRIFLNPLKRGERLPSPTL